MTVSPLEIQAIDERVEQPLVEFFHALKEAGDDKYFHPHPFTEEAARKLTHYTGKDLYYVLIEGDKILGYGMLRGWDEGYDVPSLGTAIRASARGLGFGKLFMHFLHAAARRRGASRIRLKVYPSNKVAVALYKGLGYRFESEEEGQLVGFVDL
jgi:[ribosomal protein S18]-alanine N-acetyltransferase